jgi:hypothetical protein
LVCDTMSNPPWSTPALFCPCRAPSQPTVSSQLARDYTARSSQASCTLVGTRSRCLGDGPTALEVCVLPVFHAAIRPFDSPVPSSLAPVAIPRRRRAASAESLRRCFVQPVVALEGVPTPVRARHGLPSRHDAITLPCTSSSCWLHSLSPPPLPSPIRRRRVYEIDEVV